MKVLVLVQIAKFVLLCSLLAAGVIEAVWHLTMLPTALADGTRPIYWGKSTPNANRIGSHRWRSGTPQSQAFNVQKEIPYGAEGKLFVWRDKLRDRLCGYADCALSLSDLS
ncbi:MULTISPECIES: hypothetical protein [Marinobacter]|jgi:hypothetical protein|uniref:hypothetical protein n=1 Tax=Marinobacter TaxID=2742 RepID=UPI001CFF3C8F|nr:MULTISPECIES: hypothetical protein [Marinobacter]|tara:strand:+ start:85 stop:417 length:333 start_codon:yes stop_codon:yes gene_type:complete